MSENGEIYTTGKNFTLPPGLTGWTNSTSGRNPPIRDNETCARPLTHLSASTKHLNYFMHICLKDHKSIQKTLDIPNQIKSSWLSFQTRPDQRLQRDQLLA